MRRTSGKRTLLTLAITSLAVGALVSVGFSAWTIGAENGNQSGYITINADSVAGNYYEALFLSKAEVTSYGFENNGVLTDSAELTLQYNIKNYQDILGKNMSITFTLSYDSSSFSTNIFTEDTCSLENATATFGSYSLAGTFTEALPTAYKELTHNVKITVKGLDFTNNGSYIAETLPSLKFKLSTGVSIT